VVLKIKKKGIEYKKTFKHKIKLKSFFLKQLEQHGRENHFFNFIFDEYFFGCYIK